jgi:hypothetical protein
MVYKDTSKRISKYRDIIPLTEDIAALGIGLDELLAFEIAINQSARHYNLPFVSATMRLIDDIKSYNKINDIKGQLTNCATVAKICT